MIPGIRIGTIAECEILNRLAPDRFLVRMKGRDLVMQFSNNPASEARVEVQIVDVRNNTVFARVLENEHSMTEIVRQFGLKFDIPAPDLEAALRFLRLAGLALTEETVRKFLGLKQAWGDRDLALAGLIRRYPQGLVEKLLASSAGDPKQALAGMEKFVIDFPENTEYRRVIDLLHHLNQDSVKDLQTSLLVFRPDLEHWLWKELKEQRRDARHMKLALLDLKRSHKGGKGLQDGIEGLLSRLNLDNLRSVRTACYAAWFFTLWWKDEGGWRETSVTIRRSEPEDEYLLELRTEFDGLGRVLTRVRHSPSRGSTAVRVGVADPAAMAFVKERLTIDGLNVEVGAIEGWEEDLPFGSKNWKKIDLVV